MRHDMRLPTRAAKAKAKTEMLNSSSSPICLVEKTFLFGISRCAIFGVETDRRGTVFMRVDDSNYNSDSRWVVFVDAARFLAAWCLTPGERGELGRQGLSGWLQDYKFAEAEDGFSKGRTNPVPLALPGIRPLSEGGPLCVDFTNGITRTMWLLAAGAKAFPVECRSNTVDELHSLAGIPEMPPMTVQNLLSDLSWESWLEKQGSS